MTDTLEVFAIVPSTIRVRWIERPTIPTPNNASLTAESTPILWEGHATEDDHLWSDHNGTATVSETRAIAIGCARDGTVRGFCAETLLVVGDDGRILTLPARQVRVLP